jgi:hypothetical protein
LRFTPYQAVQFLGSTSPNGTKKRPDFKAVDALGCATIVEGTVVTEVGAKKTGADRRLSVMEAKIDEIASPDYFLSLDFEGQAATPVPARQFCSRLESWIGTLDYDDVLAKSQLGQRFFPRLELHHDGLTLLVRPIPKRQEKRGLQPCKAIGIQSFEPVWGTSRRDIRDALKDKALRYGRVHAPYIVVVNCIGELCDWEDIDDALYDRDGLWPPNRTSFTRLSAVLALHHLFPWSIPRCSVRLYHNPDAKLPYSGALTCLPQAIRKGGEIARITGRHPREIFELSEDWPNE